MNHHSLTKYLFLAAFLTCALECGAVPATLPLGAGSAGVCSVAAAAGMEAPAVAEALSAVAGLERRDTVTFLTPDGLLEGEVDYHCRDVNGMEARAGRLAGDGGFFRLVAGPSVLFGVVEDYVGDRRYEITGRRGDGTYEVKGESLLEYQRAIPQSGTPENPSLYSTSSITLNSMTPEEMAWASHWDDDEVVELTILVIYSHDTIAAAGSLENANAKVASGMAQNNLAMQNSLIPARLTLAGTYLSDYAETQDSSKDLSALREGRDGFEFVPAMRDKLAADFVVYTPRVMTSGWAGLGYVSGSETGSPDDAYHVVLYSYIEDLSWVHEWGHNMGGNHSYEQSSSPGPENGGLFGHSLGCYFYATNLNKRCLSIMTYQGTWNGIYYGYRMPYFSGPELSYGGSSVSYNNKTRVALVWRKIRKFASLYRREAERTEFDCAFSPSENFYEGDASYQQGLKPLSASGTIVRSGGNYYLHSRGGNGFELPVNVKSDNGYGSYKVSVRVKPQKDGTFFDLRGRDESLCYLKLNSSGNLELHCGSSKGSGVNKTVNLGSFGTAWQEWTLWIDEASGEIFCCAVDGAEQALSGCYAARPDVFIKAAWFKDVSASGADFDDFHADCGVACLDAVADMVLPGAALTEIQLTNLNPRTTCKYDARILEGADCFSLTPASGVFKGGQKIQVGISNLPKEVGYKECIVEIEAGSGGRRVVRFGAPCGAPDKGYGLYSADLTRFPLGNISDYDSCWEAASGASCDLDYIFDHHTTEVLVDDDYEQYADGQELAGNAGWSGGYGTLGKDGTVTVRSGHNGGKYVEIAYKSGLFGAHRDFETKMRAGWWQGHTKGYFRVSFDARLTGSANKYFGFWNPQMVEGNFERQGDQGYRFRSNASDVAAEFVSKNYLPESAWRHVSMIVEAVPVKSGDNYRHILRQYKVDDKVENCYAPCDQSNTADYFNTLRFFLWGQGTFCIDNLKVETIVSETDYETLDFPDRDPMNLVVANGAALCNINLTDELAAQYDLQVRAALTYPAGLGSLEFGQDGLHRQFTTTFQSQDGRVLPGFPDCQGAGSLSKYEGVGTGEEFIYGYDISTRDKKLFNVIWKGEPVKAKLDIQGAQAGAGIQALRIAPGSGSVKLTSISASLVPHVTSDPVVLWSMQPLTLGRLSTTLELTNLTEETEAVFSLSLKDGSHFSVSPSSGIFSRSYSVTVSAKNLEGEPRYLTDLLTIDCGAGGQGVLKLGAPGGAGDQGYVLYDEDFSAFPAGDPRSFDPAIQGGPDAAVEVLDASGWQVYDTILEEDFEGYSDGQSLDGQDGWSTGYGTTGVNGTMKAVRENGETYLSMRNLGGLYGVHKALGAALDADWVQKSGHTAGFYRISYRVRFTGDASKTLTLWDPGIAESTFKKSGSSYRFYSGANAGEVKEFVSEAPVPENEWTDFSCIISAAAIKDENGDSRHVLRRTDIGGLPEFCWGLMGQENPSSVFGCLRLFQWGEGSYDIDDLKVERLVADRDGEDQHFLADKYLKYSRTGRWPSGEGGLFIEAGLPEGYTAFDFCLDTVFRVNGSLTGSLVIGQDADHRQMQGTIVQKEGGLSLAFTDCKAATELLSGTRPFGEPVAYGVRLNTASSHKEFRGFTWGSQTESTDLPITSKSVKSAEGVEKIRFYLQQKDQAADILGVRLSLVPAVPEPAALLALLALAAALAARRR